MKIRDVMTPDIEVVTPDDTLGTAAQLMADLECDVLPVSETNHLIGMITCRDIAMRVAAAPGNPKEVTVGQAMTGDVLYCFENEPVGDVSQKMADWWVRRLPVVNQNKRLIGTVSLGELTASKTVAKPQENGTRFHRSQPAGSARRARGARGAAAAA